MSGSRCPTGPLRRRERTREAAAPRRRDRGPSNGPSRCRPSLTRRRVSGSSAGRRSLKPSGIRRSTRWKNVRRSRFCALRWSDGTLPLGNSVATCLHRGVFILPVGVNVSDTGSNNSAVTRHTVGVKESPPPAKSTFPLRSTVTVGPARTIDAMPPGVKKPPTVSLELGERPCVPERQGAATKTPIRLVTTAPRLEAGAREQGRTFSVGARPDRRAPRGTHSTARSVRS